MSCRRRASLELPQPQIELARAKSGGIGFWPANPSQIYSPNPISSASILSCSFLHPLQTPHKKARHNGCRTYEQEFRWRISALSSAHQGPGEASTPQLSLLYSCASNYLLQPIHVISIYCLVLLLVFAGVWHACIRRWSSLIIRVCFLWVFVELEHRA